VDRTLPACWIIGSRAASRSVASAAACPADSCAFSPSDPGRYLRARTISTMPTSPSLRTAPLSPGPLGIGEAGLVPQPERPSQFPIRVPVIAECAGTLMHAEVLGSTGNVLLLQGTDSSLSLPALATPIRLR